MTRSIPKTASSKEVRPAAQPSAGGASAFFQDLDSWPQSWMGVEDDLPPGEAIAGCFRPFMEHLASSGLSPKSIRRHVQNLWLLGGEIIRDLHRDPALRKLPAEQVLAGAVDAAGGLLLHSGSEEEQHSFDSTCRKLHKFLSRPRH